jgi:hypothetical protein
LPTFSIVPKIQAAYNINCGCELIRYKQDYEITRNLNTDGVVKAYGLELY